MSWNSDSAGMFTFGPSPCAALQFSQVASNSRSAISKSSSRSLTMRVPTRTTHGRFVENVAGAGSIFIGNADGAVASTVPDVFRYTGPRTLAPMAHQRTGCSITPSPAVAVAPVVDSLLVESHGWYSGLGHTPLEMPVNDTLVRSNLPTATCSATPMSSQRVARTDTAAVGNTSSGSACTRS